MATKKWKMPKWMKEYAPLFVALTATNAKRIKYIEERMNRPRLFGVAGMGDAEQGYCAGFVHILEELHDNRLLKEKGK
jgi:hypothetical protein